MSAPIVSRYNYTFGGVAYPPGAEIPREVYDEHRPSLVDGAPEVEQAPATAPEHTPKATGAQKSGKPDSGK